MEGRIAAQLEGHRLAVLGDLPALGQLRLELAVVVGDRSVREFLAPERHQAIIGIDRDAVGWPVGTHPVDVKAVGSEFVRDHQRFALCILGEGHGRTRDHGAGTAGGGSGLDEAASIHGFSGSVGTDAVGCLDPGTGVLTAMAPAFVAHQLVYQRAAVRSFEQQACHWQVGLASANDRPPRAGSIPVRPQAPEGPIDRSGAVGGQPRKVSCTRRCGAAAPG